MPLRVTDVDHPHGDPATRYEVAIETGIAFENVPLAQDPLAEPFPITFEGRTFHWHASHRDPDTGAACFPTVTTVTPKQTSEDWAEVRASMERFLSALSYHTGQPILARDIKGTSTALTREKSPPAVRWQRGEVPGISIPVLRELVVVDDERLHIVMGYWREGRATGSPFFRFLAYYNALEVACEDVQGKMQAWLRPLAGAYSDRLDRQPDDLWKHLTEDRRHAVAHAVRDPDKPPDLDPNDPAARERFWADCRVLTAMIRQRVEERWGRDAVRGVPNL